MAYPTEKTYSGVPIGLKIRRQIAKQYIYRVRPGNGYYGTELGRQYQDRMTYFVPSSINNSQGASARTALTQAVYNWKNILTPEQKAEYNKRANKKRFLSGYNLYVGEYVKANA